MLRLDIETGKMWEDEGDTVFADRPYVYSVSGRVGDGNTVAAALAGREINSCGDRTVVTGTFEELQLELRQQVDITGAGIEETISFRNSGATPCELTDIGLGFAADTGSRRDWRLCAIPFRVQLDGSRHDYSTADLSHGNFRNAVYRDSSRAEPPLIEDGRLRSEAWAWWQGDSGLVIIKYNNTDIELSVAAPLARGGEHVLRFGGAGTCLYGEPSRGHRLAPGEEFTFGTTYYVHVEGAVENAFGCYRDFLDSRGHGFPGDYNPPVNWNELYDVGWHHSDAEQLKKHYTREKLLEEVSKARDCGCELLYLDPGWEVAEGTTLWDEARLGPAAELVRTVEEDYGLQMGFRTILRCYADHWPLRHVVQHAGQPKGPLHWGDQPRWELCLCDNSFREQKLGRILEIARQGMRFLMVDEMDWRGPCHDPEHGHDVPSSALDHALAVYGLCRELRERCPGLVIECHDPVWPWNTSRYVPTYFQQGFGEHGAYDENWGFEYMWHCIDDLKTGKALALYYYNLACNMPLYLHITMAADNDNCLFFWWAASTVRHLGIGGKYSHDTVEPEHALVPHDPEKRFEAYRKQMRLYRSLKPYFVRGTFHGLAEHIHLHTLPGREGGVLVMFNLSETDRAIEVEIPRDLLQSGDEVAVDGADAASENGRFRIRAEIAAMSPVVVRIGEAAGGGSV